MQSEPYLSVEVQALGGQTIADPPVVSWYLSTHPEVGLPLSGNRFNRRSFSALSVRLQSEPYLTIVFQASLGRTMADPPVVSWYLNTHP